MEFKAVRDGRVRILLGLIAKLGIGTNLQTRLCALPHLDAPWRPCDVEPREGRILRHGNQCEDVAIFRYVTEGSFDSYRWQTLETKARSIAQVMKGDKGIRSLEDVALAALSSAALKALASGNPLVIKKAGVDAEAARLSTLFSVWRDQRYANESEVSRLPMMIKAQQRPTRDELRAGGREIEQLVGRFGGNALGVQATRGEEVPSLYLSGACLYSATPYQTGPALVAVPVNLLASIPKQHAAGEAQLQVRRKRLDDIRIELQRPFEHEARLLDLMTRQRELPKRLDLDKDEAGTAKVDTEELQEAA